jgi:outer membrane protein
MSLKIFSLSALLVASGISALAQSASAIQANGNVVQLSLSKAVEIALQHNLNVKSYEVSLRNAELQFQQSKNNALPNLSANINQSASFGRSINPFTNGYDSRNINYNNLGLNAGMLLFNGGQIRNTVLQNDFNLKASQEDLASIKENISLQVVLAYLAILNSEDQLSIAKSQTEITKLQIARTEKLVNAGSLAPSNLLDLKAQLASDESSVVNFQSSLDLNKLTLLQLLNDSSISTIALQRIQVPTPSSNGYDTGIEELYTKALIIQPLVKAADLRVQSAQKSIAVAKAGTMPTLSLSASVTANQSNALNLDYFDQINNTQNKVISLGLNIPIFSRFAVKTRVAQAGLQRENASIEASKARLTLRQNIEQAYVNLTNSAKKYEAGLSQVSALEESFRAAESRFGAGTIDFVSYNLQKTNLDKARLSLIQSKYDFVFRTKILDFYQGKSLTF